MQLQFPVHCSEPFCQLQSVASLAKHANSAKRERRRAMLQSYVRAIQVGAARQLANCQGVGRAAGQAVTAPGATGSDHMHLAGCAIAGQHNGGALATGCRAAVAAYAQTHFFSQVLAEY